MLAPEKENAPEQHGEQVDDELSVADGRAGGVDRARQQGDEGSLEAALRPALSKQEIDDRA